MKTFRWNSISVRLFVWFLVPTLFLLFLLTGIFYTYSTKQMNARMTEISEKNVLQAGDTFSLLAQSYNSMSKSITASSDVQRVLAEGETTPALQLINERTVVNVLESVFNSRNDLAGLHIITNSGKIYSYDMSTPVYRPFLQSPWYEAIRRSQGEMIWFGMKQPTLTVKDDPVFSFGRIIYDLYSRKPLGVLLIEANPRPIVSALDNLRIGPQSRSYIMDSGGLILAETGKAETQAADIDRLLQTKGAARIASSADGANLIVAADEQLFKWTVVSVIPKAGFQVQLEEANRFFLVVIILLLAAAVVLATVMSRSISAPIVRLVREMRAVERGNLHALLEIRSFEEMNYLAANFNSMVARVRKLVERMRIATASEKNAQIYALQSQVNPHFLYNTLDMIYWELDESNNERLGNIVLALSKMFRYSSEWEHSDVTLREELDQTHNYLHIIEARSGNFSEIRIDIPDEWLHFPIPKMTLQPLIENAVIHGLSKQEKPGIICVDMEIGEQDMSIRIRDNGIGIPAPKLQELQTVLDKVTQLEMQHFEEEERSHRVPEPFHPRGTEKAGIGLTNVHRRLVLKFGRLYGLHIDSEPDRGTTVTIRLPKRAPVVSGAYSMRGDEAS
ncbi:sensor histidine kinase [Paenibacillus hamazuiensis]|uniref:sensor histidine kinase n=1 Tax=Paenibacillus hamazuiensis TaxID=2936508 RepID=UPI00200FA4E8|nr:sensor histidine kinase [Paenibacillus hamazuiensis]